MSKIQLANDFVVAALSDTGLQRERNEDSYGVDAELGLMLLADGMGGYERGDVASSEAVQRFSASMQALLVEPEAASFWGRFRQRFYASAQGEDYQLQCVQQAEQLIQDLFLATHNDILELNQQSLFGSGIMGTTLVGMWLWPQLPGHVLVFHAGDSRAYRYRAGQLKQLTTDHSLYQQWVDEGQIGKQPAKNIVLQALGVVSELQPDIELHILEESDRLLLCSDGLTTMVDDLLIEQLMAQLTPINLEQSCQDLIDQANAMGGLDNISVILSCHK